MKENKLAQFGEFYTPDKIAVFLAERTLFYWFYKSTQDQEPILNWNVFLSTLKQNPQTYLQKLNTLTILDPAVGSGIFLLKMAGFLERIYLTLTQKTDSDEKIREEIVKNHLFGWDIQSGAVADTIKILAGWINRKNKSNTIEITKKIGENFEICDSLAKISNLKKELFSIIIGNPPYGNILSIAQKKNFQSQYHCRLSEISELFIELGLSLINTQQNGILTYILPKTIAYYQNWQLSREMILETQIHAIIDLGIAFPNVNFEEIGIILEKTPTNMENSCQIFQAQPLKSVDKTDFTLNGKIRKEIMNQNKIILFSPLKLEEMKLIDYIHQNCDFLPSLTQDPIFSNSLFRSKYISDKEKSKLKPGNQYFLNKVPDIGMFRLNKLYKIEELPKYQPFLRPKLLFKVLRGSRLICYPDILGNIFTTEKVVNFFPDTKWYPYLEGLALILNTRAPSFYLQSTLYSGTTESSRVLDPFYAARIPVPRMPGDKLQFITQLGRILLITQYFEPLIQKQINRFLNILIEFFACCVYFPEIMINEAKISIWKDSFIAPVKNRLNEISNLLDLKDYKIKYQKILEGISLNLPIEKGKDANHFEIVSNSIISLLLEKLNQIYQLLSLSDFESFWLHKTLYNYLSK